MRTPDRTSPTMLDWAAVRRRLEATQTMLAEDAAPSPERTREVLAARARRLARPLAAAQGDDHFDAVTFALASERYAIASHLVVEVFKLAELALLPGARAPVLGVTSWRGGLLTILDLRSLLGLHATALNDLVRVIVVGDQRPAFGVLADEVRDVVRLHHAALRQPAERPAGARDFVRGITDDALIVLDTDRLLQTYS